MTYACPHCTSDELEVVVSVWAELTQDEDGNFETDTSTPDNSSHEWDEQSAMRCRSCNYVCRAKEFEQNHPGGDLCDKCCTSGAEIDRTDSAGNTVCTECAEDEDDGPKKD